MQYFVDFKASIIYKIERNGIEMFDIFLWQNKNYFLPSSSALVNEMEVHTIKEYT
jgi:hypothetical protein